VNAPLQHQPVLLDEALAGLAVVPDGIYIDGTFGRGGHSGAILQQLGPQGRLIALDRDPAAVVEAQQRFGEDPRFQIWHRSFSELEDTAAAAGVSGRVQGLLLDLGVSSPQLDDPERGFSFQSDGPLDMRMDPTKGVSAADWLNSADEQEIGRVLHELGEERFSRRIARAICVRRQSAPLRSTFELAELIRQASPRTERNKHPATRSFQAIRIFINGELEALRSCLQQALRVLAVGARVVVISFHSLEDRIVKQFFKTASQGERLPKGVPVVVDQLRPPKLRLLGKVRAGEPELAVNPRARSAVLRIAEVLT